MRLMMRLSLITRAAMQIDLMTSMTMSLKVLMMMMMLSLVLLFVPESILFEICLIREKMFDLQSAHDTGSELLVSNRHWIHTMQLTKQTMNQRLKIIKNICYIVYRLVHVRRLLLLSWACRQVEHHFANHTERHRFNSSNNHILYRLIVTYLIENQNALRRCANWEQQRCTFFATASLKTRNSIVDWCFTIVDVHVGDAREQRNWRVWIRHRIRCWRGTWRRFDKNTKVKNSNTIRDENRANRSKALVERSTMNSRVPNHLEPTTLLIVFFLKKHWKNKTIYK